QMWRLRGEEAVDAEEDAAEERERSQHAGEAETGIEPLGHELRQDGAKGRDEGGEPGFERRQPEDELQHQRHEERESTDADAEEQAADHRRAEVAVAEKRWVEQRELRATGVHQIERHGGGADRDSDVARRNGNGG